MTSASDDLVQGLRANGRDWAASRRCAELLGRVLADGSARDVIAAQRALRTYRAVCAARRAIARHCPSAPRRALAQRRLSVRELLAALLSWAERDERVALAGDQLVVPTGALLAFVASLGDDPARVVRGLDRAGLLQPGTAGELGPAMVLTIPAEALA